MISELHVCKTYRECRICMCVRQTEILELASVTESVSMCVAERRVAGRAYRAERQREGK